MANKRPPTFYVFHGSDEFSCRAQLQTMRAQMGEPGMAELNITTMDGKNVTADEVLSAASSMPFLSDKRLVIADGMLSWLGRKGAGKTGKDQIEKLVQGLPQLPDFSRVVFVEAETLSDNHAIVKLAKSNPNGYHKLFAPPSDPASWIMHHARTEHNITIETSAASALAAVIGNDLRAADSEIAKLAAYVNYERSIREADVKQMTTYSAEASVFEMVDAIGRRDGAAASRLLHQLLEEDEALMLFGMITRQFRLLLLAREYLNEGGNAAQIGAGIGVHEFVGKKLGQQVRSFTQDDLEKIYHFLLDTDTSIKTGKVADVLALDLLLAGISA
jgi:DNA polymerase-3 subunit delta